jgi:hypothetical protein
VENKRSVWDLISEGNYLDACQRADEDFQATVSLLPLRNKVLALLQLHKYDDAVALSEYIVDKDHGESDYDFQFMGTAKWLSGKRDSSVAIWKSALETKYTDAAGGVEVPLLISVHQYF